MTYRWLALGVLAIAAFASAQQEGPMQTQALVTLDAKAPQPLTLNNLSVKVNRHEAKLSSVAPVTAKGTQVALLIDDGLRSSVGRQISDIKSFITSLPAGAEIFVGYMQNGRVVPAQDFTTDHAAAAANIRLPLSGAGISASPYFCLSDFVKNWPGGSSAEGTMLTAKARFVIMLTNGVDPYNGSVSPLNQTSPYVDAAIADAQRGGVAVYSIYYGDSGYRGQAASFSGQNYLQNVADATGGRAYFQGLGSPVSLLPFFKQFTKSLSESYVASFDAPGTSKLVDLKFETTLKSTKLQAAQMVRPGTRIAGPAQASSRE
ncbi:vWA domain-containing protein [Edaphobacter flagellatus]|uniref:hypothetical protein n=1 Tax=Edaphobacter flagellatus TaxID=1933044 RepID=UPI0021B1FB28|nr:hypothetical protein [Edaphobacter flagellatus]